ncbi:MAG: ammonium transporter [Chloroflexi bacterium]|nr:ammonium transporter [Chloroflexota bacterium]MBI4329990.1 ammonium transporter [Chloroflexota bacterium]
MSAGDTAWILTASALVLLMTPALGFFYGGMVRRKNATATIFQSYIIIALISVQWVLFGYSLAFGPDKAGIIGGIEWFGLRGVGLEANQDYGPTIPHQAFMVFQLMFAIITPALITGAFAERMKFKTFMIFILLWATFVYDPVAHWVWASGGWLRNLGVLDFAGGAVVHITSGIAALSAALTFKTRLGFRREPMDAHNVPFVLLGAGMLWFGWFGFNAGSALAAGAVATSAFVVTNTAGAMGALTWMTLAWWRGGKPSAIGAVSGGVVGLAAVTPASGYINPAAALLIGLGGGIFCFMACRLRARLGFDDSLDVFGCHGVGGVWGILATGIFASTAVNSSGGDGLLAGNPGQFYVQLLAAVVIGLYTYFMTFILLKVLDRTMGLNVHNDDEMSGLDISQHGEQAYQ